MAGVLGNRSLTDEAADAVTRYSGYTLKLFVNNHTPVATDTAGAYTEPTYTGYAAQTPAAPTAGAISGNNIPMTFGTNTFAVTGTGGSDQAYGAFIVDGSGNFVGAQLFAGGPFPMSTAGDQIAVTGTETITRT